MSTKERFVDQAGLRQYLKPVAISVLFGAVACVAVLLLFSLILSTRNIPQSFVSPMATAAIVVGGFVAGVFSAKMIRSRGLVCGLISGAVLSMILLIASLGVSESGLGLPALLRVAFILLAAMLGGVLGVNTRKKRSAPRR